jgi:transposase
MTMVLAAGVDVGRDYLDVAIAPGGRSFRVSNDARGVAQIVERLRRDGVSRVVMESIGSYGVGLLRALGGLGIETGVVDPRRIKALRTAEGRRAKTDRLDAELIARFALAMPDVARPVPSPQALEIRALSARRRQLVELAAMEKTRLRQAMDEAVCESLRRTIAALAEERGVIERRLQGLLDQDEASRAKQALLRTVPGFGPVVTATLMADLPELGYADRKAIASLAGLAPHPDDSGTRTGRAHIQGGRPCVRAALYLAALAAVRSERGFKAEYRAMRAAGKPAKVALIAIARKLIVAANGMLKADRPWIPGPTP